MKSLLESFERYNAGSGLLDARSKTLVAVSGGVDSVVLTHLLLELGANIGIAHCNFGLRGAASDADQAVVAELAEQFNLPFHIERFNTKEFANQHKISIQMAARELRYTWFSQLMTSDGYDKLATAHHLGDQMETMLFNFVKGTGIAGLRGIKRHTSEMIRPLLFADKHEIHAYAENHELTWREDMSNQDNKYHRNKLRNQIIPQLREINPGLDKTWQDNARRYAALEELLNARTKAIQEQFLTFLDDGYSLDLSWYDAAEGAFAILENTLKAFDFNLNQCMQIADAITESGKQFNSNSHTLTIDRNKLFISEIKEQPDLFHKIVNVQDTFQFSNSIFSFAIRPMAGEILNDRQVAQLDADKVKFPLIARNWKEGDRFQPLGMKGEKKVSDFMIDEKIPVNLKKKIVLFESQGDIIWIAGYRIDDRYKITSETRSSLIIKMSKDA